MRKADFFNPPWSFLGGGQNSKFKIFGFFRNKYTFRSNYLESTTLSRIKTKLEEKNMFLKNLHFIMCYLSIFTRNSKTHFKK